MCAAGGMADIARVEEAVSAALAHAPAAAALEAAAPSEALFGTVFFCGEAAEARRRRSTATNEIDLKYAVRDLERVQAAKLRLYGKSLRS